MTIEHADDLDVTWPKLTGFLFEYRFGHVLHACYGHQFEHVGRLNHNAKGKAYEDEAYSDWFKFDAHVHKMQQKRIQDIWEFSISCVTRH